MSEQGVQVGILMGSDSDWPKIKGAAAALTEFGVPYEVHVMSAHRTPHRGRRVCDAGRGSRSQGDHRRGRWIRSSGGRCGRAYDPSRDRLACPDT